MNRLVVSSALTLLLAGATAIHGQLPMDKGSQATATQAPGQHGSYSGTLADAKCKQDNPSSACAASDSTSSFGLVLNGGQFVKFDSNGNQQAKKLISSTSKMGPISVKVTGVLQGDTLQVASIEAA